MRRLFFSLYFAVTLGLLLISWSSELLWQQLQSEQVQDTNFEIETIQLLLEPYKTLLPDSNRDLDTLLASQPFAIEFIDRASLAVLPEQREMLNADGLIYMYEQDASLTFYQVFDQSRLIKFGPIRSQPAPEQDVLLRNLVLVFSYGLLAMFILVWSRPLWRDLNLLKQQTEQVSNGELDANNKLPRQSVIYPLGQAFSAMAQRVLELLSLQKQMTHAISHDIRTPLARLKFSLAMLTGDRPNLGEINHEMQQDIGEIERLIDEMLTYGRLESAQSPLNLEEVNLYQLATNLADKLNRNSGIPIRLICSEPLYFTCDGHLMERALQNLLVNGQRHAQSYVTLTLTIEESKLIVIVADDGPGIPVADKEKIFSPFTRLEQSRNKSSGGFGLGLAIVKKIVEWHNGTVSVDSNSPTGAKFNIELPNLSALE